MSKDFRREKHVWDDDDWDSEKSGKYDKKHAHQVEKQKRESKHLSRTREKHAEYSELSSD